MLRIVIAMALLLIAVPAAARWEMDDFMISIGWPPLGDEANMAAIAEADFNVTMCRLEHLDWCRKYGVKAMLMGVDAQTAAGLADDEAIWGYYVMDEPWKAEEYPGLAAQVKEFRQADPKHPAYINLGGSYQATHPTFIEVVKPDILSFDYYQWWWGTEAHFARLEEYRAAAQEADVPLLCWIEANADERWEWGKPGATYLTDNLWRLRHSVYTNLAYGVKGIQWFVGPHIVTDGKLTQAGQDVAALNAQLKRLGPILVKLRSTAIFHTPPLPGSTRQLPADYWVQVPGEYWVVGAFKDRDEQDYLMLSNRLYHHRRWAVLQFRRPVTSVEKFDKQAGRWITLPLNEPGDRCLVEFIVGPGDGELLRIR